ncbi:subclass B3 metallo-beta-lactamase [Pedobacter fastidiosus]|uniref:Subclass B3 metallo-beta-lactamase n=1 Tax=Pedobacter fastidiosus TaxID=2765361 RepID=A0ABR7KW56_9SPHI|nr:subclass B3 metallo-beta-lactamase [Pedobacter fastidiosus]
MLVISLVFFSYYSKAQAVQEPKDTPEEWSKPYPPFRIVGNLYYVGTYDLACYLIVTPKGNILINTGLANSGVLIENSIKALGFRLADTKIILTTQAHYDHMGAMAALKNKTKASVLINKNDEQVLRDGGASDYAIGNGKSTYQSLIPDVIIKDHDLISLGGTNITMLDHPGHTKGSCSFIMDVKDGKKIYKVLIANMPTIVTEKKFSGVSNYPNIEKDFGYTLKKMKSLKFDIWLASHASQFKLHQKHQPGDGYNPAAFIDLEGFQKTIAELQVQFDKKIKSK